MKEVILLRIKLTEVVILINTLFDCLDSIDEKNSYLRNLVKTSIYDMGRNIVADKSVTFSHIRGSIMQTYGIKTIKELQEKHSEVYNRMTTLFGQMVWEAN